MPGRATATIAAAPARTKHRYGPKHAITVTGSLARIVGATTIEVNSLHGQAIDRLADGPGGGGAARPTARSRRCAMPSAPGWLLGVQWHPEWASPTTPTALLFSALSAMPAGAGNARARRVNHALESQRPAERRLTMDLQLAGKTVLITGGSKGIGKATAEVLAEEGCNLILVARDAEMLDEAAAGIRAKRQVNVRTIAADLSSDAVVRKVAQEAGEIDILVNNAGAIPPGDVLSIDDARWRQAWDLKVFGYISFCRVIYAQMKARRAGVIINVIGAAGERIPDQLHRRRRGQCVADGVHPSAGQGRAGRRAAGGGDQPGAGGNRPPGDAAQGGGQGEVGRREPLARTERQHGVRSSGHPAGDRQRRRVPGQPRVRLHHRHGADDRRRRLIRCAKRWKLLKRIETTSSYRPTHELTVSA